MLSKQFNAQKIVQFLLYFLLLTPLVYLPWMWRPAQTSKFLFFIFVTEIIFFIVLALFKSSRIVQSLRHPIILIYGIYVLFVVVSSLFGVDSLNSFLGNDIRIGGWLLLVHVWVFCAFLFVFLDRITWKRAENIFVFSGVAVALYAIMEFFRIFPPLGAGFPRTSSVIGNPIYLAGYLLLPLTIALTKIPSFKSWKNVHFFAAVVILLGIFTSGTRGAFLGILLGGIVSGLSLIRYSKSWKEVYFIVSLSVVVLASGFFLARSVIPTDSFYHRFFYFGDSNVTSRLEFWKMALNGVPEHPFIGVGYENFYRLAEKKYAASLYEVEGNYSDKPHNAFIEILVCSGVVGLGLYLLVLFFVFRSVYLAQRTGVINRKQEAILYFGFTAFLIQNCFAFDTISTLFTFSFFLAHISFLSRKNLTDHLILFPQRIKHLQIIFCLCFLFVFGWLFVNFFQPTYQFFSRIARANSEIDEVKRFPLLKSIQTTSFIYDRNALGKLYQNGAKTLYEKVGETPLVKDYTVSALEQYRIVVEAHPNRGEYWYEKADAGLLLAMINKGSIDQETKTAIEKAIELTPTRTEPYLLKATELELEGKIPEAIDLLETIRLKIPSSNKLLWTLSVLYGKQGEDAKAAELGYTAIDTGLNIAGTQGILDLVNYFAKLKDYKKVIRLYMCAINLFPEQVDLNANLAAAYAADGQIQKAIETARKYEQLKPEAKAETEQFIQSLQGSN